MARAEQYLEEYIRYYGMAKFQEDYCNLGTYSHDDPDVSVGDPLMHSVHLYDVVRRKYAGFSQLINDCFYGWTPDHPYWKKMEAGFYDFPNWHPRENVAKQWTGVRNRWPLENWLYLFLVHRLTGSGINYAKKPSGYNNTIVPSFSDCDTIEDMGNHVLAGSISGPIFTSVGYQFPAFPKPVPPYTKGGVYFLREMVPELARKLAKFLETGGKKKIREIGDFMFEWNQEKGLKAFRFQYSAAIADICDWFPFFVHLETPFYYGSNAVECIGYLTGGKKSQDALDGMMLHIYETTGAYPYNAEDVCCDFIRWIENYVRPGGDYDHIDRDKVWNNSSIKDHPFGRQKAMLDLGLIESFNKIGTHPSDDYVIRQHGMTPKEYQDFCHELV